MRGREINTDLDKIEREKERERERERERKKAVWRRALCDWNGIGR